MLTNLCKAVVSVAVAPVALVADVLTLPASAEDSQRSPFGRTGALLDNAGKCFNEAVKPTKGTSS